jgi:hypothetical protein
MHGLGHERGAAAMPSEENETDGDAPVSLTRFIEANQRLLAVLGVFVAVIVVSGQLDSAWANVFRGTFMLLALIVWLEVASNLFAVVTWWKMPRHSPHPRDWLGRAQRMYWFGLLLLVGFVLFCVYLLVNFPITSLYVLLAVIHAPIHIVLMHRCTRLKVLEGRSEKAKATLASVLSGGLTLLVLAAVALSVLAIARSAT